MLGDHYVTPLSCNPELSTNWKTRYRQIEIKKKSVLFLIKPTENEIFETTVYNMSVLI